MPTIPDILVSWRKYRTCLLAWLYWPTLRCVERFQQSSLRPTVLTSGDRTQWAQFVHINWVGKSRWTGYSESASPFYTWSPLWTQTATPCRGSLLIINQTLLLHTAPEILWGVSIPTKIQQSFYWCLQYVLSGCSIEIASCTSIMAAALSNTKYLTTNLSLLDVNQMWLVCMEEPICTF